MEIPVNNALSMQTAVIKESLRLSSPVPGVIPRVVPSEGTTWAGHYLPAGVSLVYPLRSAEESTYDGYSLTGLYNRPRSQSQSAWSTTTRISSPSLAASTPRGGWNTQIWTTG